MICRFKKHSIATGAFIVLTAHMAIAEESKAPESDKLTPTLEQISPVNRTQIMVTDLAAIDFSDSDALVESITYVLSAFLSAVQLEELTVNFQTADPEFSEDHPQRVIDRFNERLGTDSFDEQKFRFELLSRLTSNFEVTLALVQTELVAKENLQVDDPKGDDVGQKAPESGLGDLIYALPLLGLGGGGGGGGGGGVDSSLNTGVYETSEYSAQYGLGKINVSTAYARGYTGSGVVVSVLDSPFDTDHPDLAGKFETGYNGNDGSTNVTCTPGACTSTHGTFVSGIIAAQKNSVGMHGVAYGATIKPITIFNSSGTSNVTSAQLANAVAAGSGSGIAVMNNSWGSNAVISGSYNGSTVYHWSPTQSALPAAVNAAFQTAVGTTVVVFANGNDGLNSATGRVPIWNSAANAANGTSTGYISSVSTSLNVASTEGRQPLVNSNLAGAWLTVAALDSSNVIASYSNGCGDAQAFCISAPGSSIYSTVDLAFSGSGYSPSGGYGTADGTSFAAPHVAGAIAILKQQFPNLTPQQLVTLLLSTATDLGATGVDAVYGVGMLNLSAATTPQGSLVVSGARGSSVSNYTIQNSGLSLSSAFGSAARSASVGVLDVYRRAYNWDPVVSYRPNSGNDTLSYVNTLDPSERIASLSMDHSKLSLSTSGLGANSKVIFSELSVHDDLIKLSYTDELSAAGPSALDNKLDPFILNLGGDIRGSGMLRSTTKLSRNLKAEASMYRGTTTEGNFSEYRLGIEKIEKASAARLEIGRLFEADAFLGGKGYGAFAIDRPSETTYLQAQIAHRFQDNVMSTIKVGRSLTKVSFENSDFVQASGVTSNYASGDLTFSDLLSPDDKLKFSLTLPLRITRGTLSINTLDGYQADGSYRSQVKSYSLGNTNTPKVLGMSYVANRRHTKFAIDVQLFADRLKSSTVSDRYKIKMGIQKLF